MLVGENPVNMIHSHSPHANVLPFCSPLKNDLQILRSAASFLIILQQQQHKKPILEDKSNHVRLFKARCAL